ncbi:MAG TPA: redoxin family protein [Polyangiaceae bacterium]
MDLKVVLCCVLVACSPALEPQPATGEFPGTDGLSHPLVDPGAAFTVVEFFSARCPCQAKHDERLQGLVASYRDQGVAFVAVDSEADATLSRDKVEAARRGYSYAILVDPDGRAARAMKADYATYSLLLDRTGRVLYRGGIDSDRSHLRDDAIPYLRNAIDDAVAARAIRVPAARTLGCSLALR